MTSLYVSKGEAMIFNRTLFSTSPPRFAHVLKEMCRQRPLGLGRLDCGGSFAHPWRCCSAIINVAYAGHGRAWLEGFVSEPHSISEAAFGCKSSRRISSPHALSSYLSNHLESAIATEGSQDMRRRVSDFQSTRWLLPGVQFCRHGRIAVIRKTLLMLSDP